MRGLVGSCLAKHPDDRPTAGHVLTQVEAIQRQSGWLEERAGTAEIETEAENQALAGVSSGAGPTAVEPQPVRAGRDLRHRVSRSLPLFVPGLAAALAVAMYLASHAIVPSPTTLDQPQAGVRTPAVQAQPQGVGTAAIPGLAPSATPTQHGSASAHKDQIGQPIIQGPAISAFLSPAGSAAALTVLSPSATVASEGSPVPVRVRVRIQVRVGVPVSHRIQVRVGIDVSAPVFDVSAPVFDVSAPVFDVSAPVFDVSAPVFDVSAPVLLHADHARVSVRDFHLKQNRQW